MASAGGRSVEDLVVLAGFLRDLLAMRASDRRACAAFLPLFAGSTPENRALAARALDELLGLEELAVLCGVDERTLRRWRRRLLTWELRRIPCGRKGRDGELGAWR